MCEGRRGKENREDWEKSSESQVRHTANCRKRVVFGIYYIVTIIMPVSVPGRYKNWKRGFVPHAPSWHKNWNNKCHNTSKSKFRRRHVFCNWLYRISLNYENFLSQISSTCKSPDRAVAPSTGLPLNVYATHTLSAWTSKWTRDSLTKLLLLAQYWDLGPAILYLTWVYGSPDIATKPIMEYQCSKRETAHKTAAHVIPV